MKNKIATLSSEGILFTYSFSERRNQLCS